MPTSQIDRKINFTDSEKVIFLVNIKKTLHAFILVESANGQMTRYDFATTATPGQAIRNGVVASSNKALSNIPGTFFSNEVSAGLPGHVSINAASVNDLITFAEKGELQYQSWVGTQEQHQALFQLVCLDVANPPQYGLNGKEATFGAKHHNCYTWSVEKLQQTQLKDVSLHWTAYLLVAKPNMVDKPAFCALL